MEISEENRIPGGPKYEGFIVDLLNELANVTRLTYDIGVTPDGRYGGIDDKGNWYGMIGELVNKRADVAAADLAITEKRSAVVDFTTPYLQVGITILLKKPDKISASFFSFLNPFSPEVWMCLLTAYLSVSILMFLLARLSPLEWINPHPCNQNSSVLKNDFNLMNSLWFNIGSLMQQGPDIQPRAISTRIVAGTWWFFTLIMISSYTASLAAFLTAVQTGTPIHTVEDLARQSKIKYGLVKGGATHSFFEKHNSDLYKKMWSVMELTEPTVFARNNEEAVTRVKLGDYAFFAESLFLEYVTARDCELQQVGGLLDSKGHGLAVPKNSPHWKKLNRGIMLLQERGVVHALRRRWWLESGLASPCPPDVTASIELDINNVGGVFIILFVGLGIAFLVVVFEFIWHVRKKSVHKGKFVDELKSELRFAARLCSSTKPAPKPQKDESDEVTSRPRRVGVRFQSTAV